MAQARSRAVFMGSLGTDGTGAASVQHDPHSNVGIGMQNQ
jgi:hypothetical protein